MARFVTTLLIAFVVIAAMTLLINFCRRRLRNTKHGLTGMCHRNGGPACPTCGDQNSKNSSSP
jgi:hypothetical protein